MFESGSQADSKVTQLGQGHMTARFQPSPISTCRLKGQSADSKVTQLGPGHVTGVAIHKLRYVTLPFINYVMLRYSGVGGQIPISTKTSTQVLKAGAICFAFLYY